MSTRTLRKRTWRFLRTVSEKYPAAGKWIHKYRTRTKTTTGANFTQIEGRSYTIVQSRSAPEEKRVGIYVRGGCDLGAMNGVPRLFRESGSGTLALRRDSIQISGSRSDLLLQALDGIDPGAAETVKDVSRRLQLNRGYFDPRLFDPTFTIPNDGFGPFEKTVIVLSIGPDVARSLYRHREHGFLVDPGGFWLSTSIDNALANQDSIKWFAKNFESIGRLSSEEFRTHYKRLITEIHDRTNAHVLVFNILTPDPLERNHNFGMVSEPDSARRLEFAVALADLSHELDFDIVDVDRILKLEGVVGQVDFAHFMEEHYESIGREAYRVLKERELV